MASTVDELIDRVRDDIDEDNLNDVSDDDILQKLNRAQRKGVLKIIRNYDSLFLTSRDVTTVGGTADYAWASDVYAGKVKKLELIEQGRAQEIRRMWFRQSTPLVSSQTTTRPSRYELIGKKWRLYGTPASGLTIREWYVRTPENMVKQQGRVVSSGIDAGTSQPFVILDTLGSSLSTSTTLLNCFVNFIDRDTGLVRGSAQIASINTTTKMVMFKIAGLNRTTVLGKAIGIALPTTLAQDDYICTIHGTCVSEVPDAYHDYLTQHAVVSIKRAKGEPTQEDYAALKDEEKDIEQIYQGTEQRIKVAQRNPSFRRNRR